MAGMYLYGIESGFYCQFNCLAVCIGHFIDLLHVHLLDKRRGVEVESAACAIWHAPAYAPVRHVSAMSELDGNLCSLRVDGVCQLLQFRNNLFAHP